MFLSSFVTSLGSVVTICSILGTQEWATSKLTVTYAFSNGSVNITYGLFRGKSVLSLQGLSEPDKSFEVLGILDNSSPRSLQLVTVLFLVVSLFASLMSSVFTFYNSISNPYQTFLGPAGVYTWNGISAFSVFLTMVLFVGNTQSNRLSEDLCQKLYSGITIRGMTHSYGYSFWLILLIILLNALSVVIIFFYQRARQQQKQAERKPMEHAPRDGILF